MPDSQWVWSSMLDVAEEGRAVPLKGGRKRTFHKLGTSIGVDEVTAPSISRSQIERALAKHPLEEWPLLPVSELDDSGNTTYIWALLRFVATGGDQPGAEVLEESRALSQQLRGVERALHERIRQADADGFSLRQIGEAAGLSHQTIARIVEGAS